MAFAPARVRSIVLSKAPSTVLLWSRQRSTVAERAERASCQLDAKLRVKEHARHISRSAPGKAATAPSV